MARQAFDAHSDGVGAGWGAFFTSWSFQTSASDAAGAFRAGEWMRDLVAAPLVILDDLGKCDWTSTAAAAFFELIDQRTAHHRRTVITANMGAAQLRDWMSTGKSEVLQRAMEPIARRIREHGAVVVCV
jgi:DNA replication protein DnaC